MALSTVSPEHFERVIGLFMRAFPDLTVAEFRVRRYRPGVYVGPDAGPCRRFGGLVRLYGPYAYPFCLDCQPRK
jgi:hypothetical protein